MEASPRSSGGASPAASRAWPPTRSQHADAAALVRRISTEVARPLGRAEVVAADVALLRSFLRVPPARFERAVIRGLAGALRAQAGPIVQPLVGLFTEMTRAAADPWPFAEPLLRARDPAAARAGLDALACSADEGRRADPARVLAAVAARRDPSAAGALDAELVGPFAEAWRALAGRTAPEDAFGAPDPQARRLAAAVLDAEGADPAVLAERVLPEEARRFLDPYLSYTRAGHADLESLLEVPGADPPALASLRRAESMIGPAAMREMLATVGWARVRRGVDPRPLVAVSFDGSFPSLLTPAEAATLADEGARPVATPVVVFAHGGRGGTAAAAGATSRIARFRTYCLRHADILPDFVDFEPLFPARARDTLARMDVLVAEHDALFRAHGPECVVLAERYAALRDAITERLDRAPLAEPLDAETTRLLRSFEDPGDVDDVRTLHGLKRFLHQRSLRLAARLLADPAAAEKTLDILAFEGGRMTGHVPPIRWTDPDPDPDAPSIPPPAVRDLADALARALVHGHRDFPAIRVLSYGSESHTYLTWWSHPAFLRVDRTPPLRGGLVDLEYFGVSKAELNAHPDPSLPVLRRLLEAEGFDVTVEATRVHVRYDKERAQDAEDLCAKARALLALAPHLMDVDWVLGSLRLDPDARRRAGEALVQAFARRGVLAWGTWLTKDRTGIRAAPRPGPAGAREEAWSGDGPVPDPWTDALTPDRAARWAELLTRLGLPDAAKSPPRSAGPRDVEDAVLRPLRAAAARGALEEADGRLQPVGPERCGAVHEAELFAAMAGNVHAATDGVRVARIVSAIERSLRFTTSGAVQGWPVQRARALPGGEGAGVFVLRDPEGVVRLAAMARGGGIVRCRADVSRRWSMNLLDDPAGIVRRLRRAGILEGDVRTDPGDAAAEAERICAALHAAREGEVEEADLAGAAVEGRAIGRGRVAGIARLTDDAEAVDEEILVRARLGPRDLARLRSAAGVVATGGSALSHAGLVLGQSGKPAVLVAGRWSEDHDGSRVLHIPRTTARTETRDVRGVPVSVRREGTIGEWILRDGDLVVVDADRGILERLGNAPSVLALHHDLRSLGADSRALAAAADPREMLRRRGRVLRTAGRLRGALDALDDAAVAAHVVHEFLDGATAASLPSELRRDLLGVLFTNPAVGGAARARLDRMTRGIVRAEAEEVEGIAAAILGAESVAEVLARRCVAMRRREAAGLARGVRQDAGFPAVATPPPSGERMDRAARGALRRLWRESASRAAEKGSVPAAADLDVLQEIDAVAPVSTPRRRRLATWMCAREDAARHVAESAPEALVLGPADAGATLASRIGAKAANLAAIERELGRASVPAWFALTGAALRRMLEASWEGDTLEAAIGHELARKGDGAAARAEEGIRRLFARFALPADVARALRTAYAALAVAGETEARVAVRSSACEEDLPGEPRAGEFDTMLGVCGAEDLERAVRRTWAGFWTERAILRRRELGLPPLGEGGGLLVQRLVCARVSGVVRTRGAEAGTLDEMLVEAGLGLGEGVVSGLVAADEIHVVRRPGETGLDRCRYVTHDKEEMIVPDGSGGPGTVRVRAKSHQRLRPALEWIELDELVRASLALERAWHRPLDLEFAFEADRLFLLQARPLPAFFAAYRDTLERHPLAPRRRRPPSGPESPS